MALRVLRTLSRKTTLTQYKSSAWITQSYCTDKGDSEGRPHRRDAEGSASRMWRILKDDLNQLKTLEDSAIIQAQTDYLVIGAGLVGSAVAYWLKRSAKGADVAVIERDYGYTQASSMLSVGGIRHQFSQPENVQLSMFTTDFFRNIRQYLSILEDDDDPPDVQFNHQGYLFLAKEDKAQDLLDDVQMQRELGANIEILTKDRLAAKFPWINLEGIEVGSYGIEGEGWFDPWSLLKAFRKKNINMGVKYVKGEVVGFNKGKTREKKNCLESVDIKDNNDVIHTMSFMSCVNCAGPWAGELAKLADIGVGDELLQIPLPVEPRKRFVYVVHCPDGPPVNAPLTVDPLGTYFRREGLGGHYLCGASPAEGEEPSIKDLEVDYEFFDKKVWPDLAHRVPAFEKLKLKSAWAGFYDYNYVDQNLIIGNHPLYRNLYFANGMSGHGAQQSVAIGRSVSELVVDNKFETIDLSRYTFNRFLSDDPITEKAIV